MNRSILYLFGMSLGLTLLLEVPPGLFFCRKGRPGIRAAVLVLANLLTNPAVAAAALMYRLSPAGDPRILPSALAELVLETAAVLAEWKVYQRFQKELGLDHPFLLSLGLNAWSYAAGKLLQALF